MKRIIIGAVLILSLGLGVVACDSGSGSSNAQSNGQQQTEAAFAQQSTAVPYPSDLLKDSLERRNLRERLLRFNNPNKIGYVYLVGLNGNYIGFYTIKGKISSPDSQMTTQQLIVSPPGTSDCRQTCQVVGAPGDDGSYGPNEKGIFFFTTEGVLVEVNTDYIYSDAPLTVNAPQLNASSDKPSSVGEAGSPVNQPGK